MSSYAVHSERLEILCRKIGSGITPRGGASVYIDDGTALIRSQNVYNSEFSRAGLAFINDETAQRMQGVSVQENDVLLNITGESVARSCIVPTNVLPARVNQHVAIIRTNPETLDPNYLAHFLVSPRMQSTMLSWSGSGGTRKALTKKMIEGFTVPLLPLGEQKRIASILSAYDDLIENNRRRIALLEEAARQLYKEWFVQFRFPGHEHVKIIDGMPEGWEKKRIVDICTKIGSGATPRGGAASYQSKGISLIRSLNIYDYDFHDHGLVFINEQQADRLANVVVEEGDVLINITGASVARCCIAPRRHLPARVNQHVMIMRPIPDVVCSEYLLCAINYPRQKQLILSIARAGGATREALTKSTIEEFEILLPSNQLMEGFCAVAKDSFDQIEILQRQNLALAKARDLLLPKLMSGEVAV